MYIHFVIRLFGLFLLESNLHRFDKAKDQEDSYLSHSFRITDSLGY